MRITLFAAALAAFFVVTISVALAQDGSVVTIPWGDWVATFLEAMPDILASLLLAAATLLVSMLPAWVQEFVRPMILTWRADQLFQKAAAAAIAGTRGAVAGQKVDVHIANELVRTVVLIAVQRGAPAVLDFAGRSARAFAEKALARLHEQGAIMPPEYTIADASHQADKVLRATTDGTI